MTSKYIFLSEEPPPELEDDDYGYLAGPPPEVKVVYFEGEVEVREVYFEDREMHKAVELAVQWQTELGVEVIKDWECFHCQKRMGPWDYYMVLDEVWTTSKAPEPCRMHLDCLEARLERPLVMADFIDCGCNKLILKAFAIAARELGDT